MEIGESASVEINMISNGFIVRKIKSAHHTSTYGEWIFYSSWTAFEKACSNLFREASQMTSEDGREDF